MCMPRFLFRSRKKTGCWTASSPDGNSCRPGSCATRLQKSRRPGGSPSGTNCCRAGRREEQRAGSTPKPRPGPGPVALFRNWISFAGTGIVAVGVLVFAVLMAYHTIGGGALAQPYGDLVIFFLPPVFIFAGTAVILAGMYLEWIRWRMNKPLSFARYPKWDLNLAAERKALLVVAIGAAIIAVPAIYGSGQAYIYTDATPFCGSVCHSMAPEYTTYQRSPHAHVTCAQCHVGPGATGYIVAKFRGMTELVETIQNDYPRPIPAPVTALHTIQGNCEECHWPSNSFGARRVPPHSLPVGRAEHALGNRLVCAGWRRNPIAGRRPWGALAHREQSGVHGERS